MSLISAVGSTHLEHQEWTPVLPPSLARHPARSPAWPTNSLISRTLYVNKVVAFIKNQVDVIKMQPIQVHYHQLDMAKIGNCYDEL